MAAEAATAKVDVIEAIADLLNTGLNLWGQSNQRNNQFAGGYFMAPDRLDYQPARNTDLYIVVGSITFLLVAVVVVVLIKKSKG